ncbi:MAG: glycerol-3-phosphate 1-O-acyltransferase PlsY [Candidatus Omnitrophica bacterium]|nr:glycerol-3-phosphate 1-O-acyltransferase PlsY [Candidatus Omnitrophota bacterium]
MSLFLITFWSIIGYLAGSLPWGYWISKYFYKIDIRTRGSGNIGATNVFRVLGPVPGIITFLLDVGKGSLPIILLKHLQQTNTNQAVLLIVGIATIVGSKFSIFLKGKGGKAVNCSFGVLLALIPKEAFVSFLFWVLIFVATGYVSLASIIAAINLPVLLWLFQENREFVTGGIIISLIIVVAHKENIKRLLQRKENRFNLWKR